MYIQHLAAGKLQQQTDHKMLQHWPEHHPALSAQYRHHQLIH